MYKRILLLLLVFQIQTIIPLGACFAGTDEFQSRLGAPIHDYDLNASSFVEALIHVADEFRIPMGIEWVNTSQARTKIVFSWKKASIREILEGIAKTQPGYQVQVRDGVVRICSTKVPADQSFLHLPVKAFEANREVVQMAARRLRELVKQTVVPPKQGPGGVGCSLVTNVGEPKIDVKLNDVSVEDVLDSLATASAKKIWVVTFADSFIPTATGFRRTLTLSNGATVPDDEQPVWDMFAWDESVSTAGLAEDH
jgi:hypothetical protein